MYGLLSSPAYFFFAAADRRRCFSFSALRSVCCRRVCSLLAGSVGCGCCDSILGELACLAPLISLHRRSHQPPSSLLPSPSNWLDLRQFAVSLDHARSISLIVCAALFSIYFFFYFLPNILRLFGVISSWDIFHTQQLNRESIQCIGEISSHFTWKDDVCNNLEAMKCLAYFSLCQSPGTAT